MCGVVLCVVFVTCTYKNYHSTISVAQTVLKTSLNKSVLEISYLHACIYR